MQTVSDLLVLKGVYIFFPIYPLCPCRIIRKDISVCMTFLRLLYLTPHPRNGWCQLEECWFDFAAKLSPSLLEAATSYLHLQQTMAFEVPQKRRGFLSQCASTYGRTPTLNDHTRDTQDCPVCVTACRLWAITQEPKNQAS